MHRVLLALVLPVGAVSLLGCEQVLVQPVVVALREDAGAAAGGASSTSCHTVPPPECTSGACCPQPTAAECYPFGNPSPYSGAECLAQRDNTGQGRWQLRQTLSVSLGPPGLTAPGIPGVLARRSELRSAACGADEGTSGFIQLIDFDRVAGRSRTGFARYEVGQAEALAAGGLCFVEELTYQSADHALSALPTPDGWPGGLPPPMPMPWKVAPVTAVRLDEDFALPRDREVLLSRFAEGGDLVGAAGGVFYLNEATGYMHGYSPVTYIVNYNGPSDYFVVPIREAEITQQVNDPEHPNCSGVLFGEIASQPGSCLGDWTNRAWGCPEGNCPPEVYAPTKVQGYFLLTELEQVYTLGQTLCSLFAGTGGYPDWTFPETDRRCRWDPRWNPGDPAAGLPRGDWCAARNDAADDGCHDAWRSVSFATFQAFPIRAGTCPPL